MYSILFLQQVFSSSWDGRPFGHSRHGPKGGARSPSNNVATAEVYLRTKWHLDPSGRLATIHGQKVEEAVVPPFLGGGGLRPPVTRSLFPYQVASWSIQPFGHNRHGPKIGGLCPFWGELGPHLTQCGWGRGRPPYQVASWILIHPTIWPQYTNVTDRQRSDSIDQTVLQTVAQKLWLLVIQTASVVVGCVVQR